MNLDDYEAEVRGSALRAKLARKLEQLKTLRQVIRFYHEMYRSK